MEKLEKIEYICYLACKDILDDHKAIEIIASEFKEEQEEDIEIEDSITNLPIVINFTEHGDGHIIMEELKTLSAKGNKDYNICRPLDILKDKKVFFSNDSGVMEKHYDILTEENCRLVFPKGDLSVHRDIIFYLPSNPDVADPKLKNTKLSSLLHPFVERVTAQQQIVRDREERINEVEDTLKDALSLELPTEALENALNTIKKAKEQNKFPEFHISNNGRKENYKYSDRKKNAQQLEDQRLEDQRIEDRRRESKRVGRLNRDEEIFKYYIKHKKDNKPPNYVYIGKKFGGIKKQNVYRIIKKMEKFTQYYIDNYYLNKNNKKGRGRPKGSKNHKRKVGRPKKEFSRKTVKKFMKD